MGRTICSQPHSSGSAGKEFACNAGAPGGAGLICGSRWFGFLVNQEHCFTVTDNLSRHSFLITCSARSAAVVLTLEHGSESPGGFGSLEVAEPHLRFRICRSGWGLSFCISFCKYLFLFIYLAAVSCGAQDL